MMMLCLSINNVNGQTVVWPTADTNTIKASQFADTALIFRISTANPTPPAGYKGWVSKGVSSNVPAKSENAHWDWSRDGRGNKGTLWGTRTAIASATASNGAGIFNSDFLDSGGNGNYGNGTAPSPQESELWSPIIDATGKNNLTLVFNQYYRSFLSTSTAVSWSEDGGTTWKDTIDVIDNTFDLIELNNQTAIKLKGSKGTANFRVKFLWSGDYYFWIIDDVKLMQMDNNLRVNKNWYAVPQNLYMPRHQLDTVAFMADIENQGNAAATNVKLTVTLKDATTGTTLFTGARNYGTIKADSIAENEITLKWLPVSTASGNVLYNGTYVISGDSPDNFPLNDTIKFQFVLSDSLFRNEPGTRTITTRPGDGSWTTGQPHSWKVGNYYYFPKGSKVTATRILTFVDTTTLVGTTLIGQLYSWKDLNGDGGVQANERKEIAAAEIPITKSSDGTLNFLLENLSGSGAVQLNDTTAYLAMLELITTKQGVDMEPFWDVNLPYAPMAFASEKIGRNRYTTIISYDGDDATPWNTGTFLGDNLQQFTPIVRLYTWPIKTDTKEPLPAANKISLFPNPADSQLNVSFDLEKNETAVLVRIVDMAGKILKERDYLDVKKQTVSLDINDIPNGIYNIQVQTLGNYRTMRFVKAK